MLMSILRPTDEGVKGQGCDPEAAWLWVREVAYLALAGHIVAVVLANAIDHALQAERLGWARPLGNLP